ncbi:hypothetical protein [Alkalithermobacter paradoxus]
MLRKQDMINRDQLVKEAKIYREILDEEIEKSRIIHAQKPLKKKKK